MSDKLQAAWVECYGIIAADEEGREADAGFDGGEFSGPEHGLMLGRALNECAQRHGFRSYIHLESMAEEHNLCEHGYYHGEQCLGCDPDGGR